MGLGELDEMLRPEVVSLVRLARIASALQPDGSKVMVCPFLTGSEGVLLVGSGACVGDLRSISKAGLRTLDQQLAHNDRLKADGPWLLLLSLHCSECCLG